MPPAMRKALERNAELLGAILAITLIFIAYGGYAHYLLTEELERVEAEFASTTSSLKDEVVMLSRERDELSEALYSEQQKNNQLQAQIQSISETVGELEKWRELDPELLQKYSKVYFLSENYEPTALSVISDKHLAEERIEEESDVLIHSRVLPRLERMLARAVNDGMNLKVASAYRSFDKQGELKAGYSITYGAGTANQFSAEQGYSEHQLGTTVDLVTPETAAAFSGFENTKEYQWLLDNAHQFGFVLSYPEDNDFYIFEPWHWRYVGERFAILLHDRDQHFYDLDQREIDTHLINIFD